MNLILYVKVPKQMRDRYGVIHFVMGRGSIPAYGMMLYDSVDWYL